MAELSGFEVLALVKEIESALRGTYVNNIYTLGDAQILRLRGANEKEQWLVATPSLGVWISQRVSERTETTEFTSKLRRELERSRFTRARQADLDRVFMLSFGEGDASRTLIVELMPPGNIILTGSDGKILLAWKEVRTLSRRVYRGLVYAPPPQRRLSPSEVGPAQISEMLRVEKTVGGAIGRHIALPRKYVAEALSRLGIDENSPSVNLAGREGEVATILKAMLDEASEHPRPCTYVTQEGEEILVLSPKKMQVNRRSDTVSELCDELLVAEVSAGGVNEPGPEERELKELEATIRGLRVKEASLLSEALRLRTLAREAEAGSIVRVNEILLKEKMSPRGGPSSPSSGASLLYDRAKELETQADDSAEAAVRLSRRVSAKPHEAKPGTKKLAKRKAEWFERFRWFTTSEGKLAIGGRDVQSNSMLVRKHIQRDDVVYHADLFGSPFFVLKGGREQTESEVRELAQATVAFSSAWKTGLASADAYWVLPDQVSTAAPSGEFLAKGSFAIKGKKTFVTRNLVEVSVGIDERGRVIAGPESAISKIAKGYVVLRPHREKGSETAKQVLRDLQKARAGLELHPTVDDVLRALPAGGGKVVRRLGAVA